jgi:hypothetical protein
MYDAGNDCHYFVDEPASLLNSKIIVPVRWLEDEKGDVWAEVWEVHTDVTTVIFPACLPPGIVRLHGTLPRSVQQSRMIKLN